jgi:hypothetical protein
MTSITAGSYQRWVESLPPDQQDIARAAGLDRPPDDGIEHQSGCVPILDHDGLDQILVNGSHRPRVDEASHDPDPPPPVIVSDLAEAIRDLVSWLVGRVPATTMLAKPGAASLRLFALARSLQIGGADVVTLADAARVAGCSRAAISKVSLSLCDWLENRHLMPHARHERRAAMRAATSKAWRRRREG